MQISKLIDSRAGNEVISCSAASSLGDAVELLAGRRIGAMPVVEGNRVIGIVSERDVLYCLAAEGAASLTKSVRDVMTAPPITVAPEASCDEALGLMTRRRVRHLPVMVGETMVGFLSIGDLVKAQLDEVSHEAAAMRDYIRMA